MLALHLGGRVELDVPPILAATFELVMAVCQPVAVAEFHRDVVAVGENAAEKLAMGKHDAAVFDRFGDAVAARCSYPAHLLYDISSSSPCVLPMSASRASTAASFA